jgi:NAD+ kinase
MWVLGKTGVNVENLKEMVDKHFILDEKNPDVVIALGGEGTVFRAVKEYPNSSIFPLRKSSFGALSQSDESNALKALNRIKKGKYIIERIMRLEVKHKGFKIWGINDISVCRDDESANRFRIFLNGKDIYHDMLIGDGVLCATPYGSTGYNWTAGGSILRAGEKNFVLTPICSAYFNRRILIKNRNAMKKVVGSKIIPNNKEIAINFFRDIKNKIVPDGRIEERRYVSFKSGEKIIIRVSEETSKFLRIL